MRNQKLWLLDGANSPKSLTLKTTYYYILVKNSFGKHRKTKDMSKSFSKLIRTFKGHAVY